MPVIMMNFIIAVLSSTYIRIMGYKTILKFKQQASINYECYQLVNLVGKFFNSQDQFKVLVMSCSIENNLIEEDLFEDFIHQLKQFVTQLNKDHNSKHTEIDKLILEVQKN
jgi:hypothetical protein